jgi:tetratricopeptide (TPR) repeat protein
MRQSNEWATVGAQEAEAAEQLSGLAHALFLVDASRQLCGEDWGPGFERALAIYRDLGDLVGQGNVLNNLGIAHWYEGHLDEALHAWEAARDVRLRSGDTMGAATQENNMAETYSDQGRYEEARAMFESARRAWRASRYPIGVAIATSNLGRLAVRGGDIDAGRKLLVDAKEQMDAIGSTMYAMEIEGRLVEALVFAGSDDSVGAAEEFVSHVASHDVADTLAPWARRLLAVAAVQVGDRDRGRAELDKAVALAEDKGWEHELAMALAARASLAEVLGIGGQAAEDARRAVAIFGRLGIQDTPVTSLDDRWPSGPGAVALVAGAVAEASS